MRPYKKTQSQNSSNNKTDNNGKHYWKKVIIAGVIGTVVGGYVNSFVSTHYVDSKQDLVISQHIVKIINDSAIKHKTYSYLNQIKDKKIRIESANDVLYYMIENMLIQQSYSGQKYKFTGYNKDCSDIVNIFAFMYSINNKSTTNTFNYLITRGPDRYNKYTNRTEFNKLLSFIASNNNVKELTTSLPKESLQLLKLPRYKNSTTAVQRGEAIIKGVLPE